MGGDYTEAERVVATQQLKDKKRGTLREEENKQLTRKKIEMKKINPSKIV